LGPSRSGKSTLALALVQSGFRLLSDDRVFCFVQDRRLVAYGLPRPLKLRREASGWFDELRDRSPTHGPNGGSVFFYETAVGNAPRESTCQPVALLFLDQQQTSMFRMIEMRPGEARARIETDLLAEMPGAIQSQEGVLNHITDLPCWHLQYKGSPQSI